MTSVYDCIFSRDDADQDTTTCVGGGAPAYSAPAWECRIMLHGVTRQLVPHLRAILGTDSLAYFFWNLFDELDRVSVPRSSKAHIKASVLIRDCLTHCSPCVVLGL